MLRLVHPAEHGQDPPTRKGRRSAALSFTAEEVQHFRAALRNVARAYGGFPVLAEVIGVPADTLYQSLDKRRRPSGILVIRLANAAGMSTEAIITGQLSPAGRCQACGARAGHAADRRAS